MTRQSFQSFLSFIDYFFYVLPIVCLLAEPNYAVRLVVYLGSIWIKSSIVAYKLNSKNEAVLVTAIVIFGLLSAYQVIKTHYPIYFPTGHIFPRQASVLLLYVIVVL